MLTLLLFKGERGNQHRGLACFHWWRAGEGSKGHVAGGESKIQLFHFPSCSSIGNQDKPGTTVRRENTRSHSDLDMWNRLAPYVLRLFGRHGPSPVKKCNQKRLWCQSALVFPISRLLRVDYTYLSTTYLYILHFASFFMVFPLICLFLWS